MSAAEGNPRPYSAATLSALADLLNEIDGEIATRSVKRSQIMDELTMRHDTAIAAQLAATGKGTAHLEIDGLKITGGITKSVKWDGPALQAMAFNMPWETVKTLFKIDFALSEASYAALQIGAALSPEGKALFDAAEKARTVQYKPQPLKIERIKA